MPDKPLSFEQCVKHAAISDIGMRRQNNQDSMNTVVAPERSYWQQRGHLYLVADGMGAHAAGELASKLAADGIPHIYAKHTDMEPPLALRQAILEANNTIYEKGHANSEFQGMGTTCSTLVIVPAGAVVGHVGDSRVYRLRDGQLQQLTFDHSLVWEMRAAGQIPADAENIHLPTNIITRSLGPNPVVKIDLEGPFPIAVNDRFLLCSDGLTGPVTDPELAAILAAMPPDEAVQALVDLANLRGGPDNITVIVVEIAGLPDEAVEQDPEPQQRSPKLMILLTLIGLIALVAVSFLFLPFKLAAFLSLAAILVTAIVAALQRLDSDSGTDSAITPSKLGAAPYINIDAGPHEAEVAALQKVAQELKQVATESEKHVDWETFDAKIAAAGVAFDRKDNLAAVLNYGRAISFAVAQLKKQSDAKSASDSHVDLI